MEEQEPQQNQSLHAAAASSSSSSSSASRIQELPGATSTLTPALEPSAAPSLGSEPVHQQTSVAYHSTTYGDYLRRLSWISDDVWSCVIVIGTFWFFVSMTLILGVYGSVSLRLGQSCSLLLQPNPIFVQYVKVEQSDDTVTGPMLYGLYKKPPLDVINTWSEIRNASLQANSHKDWMYFLNVGSQINISYHVESPSSSPLILVIAQGNEGYTQWLADPSFPNTTLSWNIIHGSGVIQQYITKSSNFYIAVGNLNSEVVEVQLNLEIRAFLYNTTEAYYKCTLASGQCSLELFFPNGNIAVLATSGLDEGMSGTEFHVKLTYGPRWLTYLVGIVGITSLMLVAFHFFMKSGCVHERRDGVSYGFRGSQRAPLLSYKDDDELSWGSSYDSVSQDGEDPEEGLASLDGKPLKDGEYNNNIRRLCAICFDAPRDCFFLPCGHCVACFACGTRIAEVAGTCPICRRNLKKVRKIYTV